MAHTFRIVVVAMVLIWAARCSSLDNITVESEGSAVVPASTVVDQLLGDISFTGFGSLDFSQDQEFANQGYTEDDIDSVRTMQFTMNISSPNDGNFDFLDGIAFYASAEGLPRVKIAEATNIAAGLKNLELDVDSSIELRPYIVAPSVTITTEAQGRRPDAQTQIDALIRFDVDINVSGAVGCNLSLSVQRR